MEPGTIEVKTLKDYLWLGLFEFIGSAIFLLGINFSEGNAGVVAFSLFIAVILCGRVGGGHYNGSVTLAIYMIERKWAKNLPIAVTIWIVDILGAYFGILLAASLQ
jgi:hypothetical protein